MPWNQRVRLVGHPSQVGEVNGELRRGHCATVQRRHNDGDNREHDVQAHRHEVGPPEEGRLG